MGTPLVLVVDDFEDAREMYAAYLTHLGYRVTTASDGLRALEAARAQSPDVIVLDLAMPVMDGWQAAKELRSQEATSRICIIALSGHTSTENRRRAVEVGCDEFLPKPCLPADLDRTIKTVLARRGAPLGK